MTRGRFPRRAVRRKRSGVMVAAVAAVLAAPWAGGGADPAGAVSAGGGPAPAIYEARAEAGGFTDSLSVPALFETFTPYSRSDAQNNASSGLHAVFYPGFLLSAAAFQQGFPPPPGTTETLFPQGPFDQQADVLPLGQGPDGPGRLAGSSGHSDATGSSGEAHYGGFAPSADFAVEFGQATTAVSAATSAVRSTADVVLHHVHIGDALVVDSVVAKAEAVADGTPGGARNSGSVVFEGATLLGTPVVLTPQGLAVGGTTGALPPATPLDDLLARAGLSVRRLPDTQAATSDGTESRLELGGVEVRFDQPDREFAVSFVLGRVSVSARAVRPTEVAELPVEVPVAVPEPPAREADLTFDTTVAPAVDLVAPSDTGVPRLIRRTIHIPAEVASAPVAGGLPSPPATAAVRAAPGRAVRPVPVRRGDWSGVSGLLALAGPAAMILRRILRVASSP